MQDRTIDIRVWWKLLKHLSRNGCFSAFRQRHALL